MKTLTNSIIIAVCVLFSNIAIAQTGTKFIKVTMSNNSNDPNQAPAVLVFSFDSNGNDSLAFPDAGNEGTLGQLGMGVYPFSLTADSFVVTNWDARPELNSYVAIPMGFVTKQSADIKVIATVFSTDSATPVADFVWLEQISTGERHSIMDTTKFTISANTNFASDFILHTGPMAASVGFGETCFNYGNGSINVSGPNHPNFTFELTQGSTPIISTVVAGIDTTISNLSPGSYVSVIRINGIPVDSSDVTITAAAPLMADFLTDYNFVTPGTTVNFTDASVGGVSYTWDFGDGDSSTTAGSESHLFQAIGSFQVTLLLSDNNGCTSSTYDFVYVDTVATSAHNNSFGNPNPNFHPVNHNNTVTTTPVNTSGDANTYYSNERVIVDLGQATATKVTVVAMNGAVIYTGAQNEARAEYSIPAAGAYIVTIEFTNGEVKSNTILAQ